MSSGVGGAGELIDDGRTGLRFGAGNSQELAQCLMRLANDQALLTALRQAGQREAQHRFSVTTSATALEAGFRSDSAKGSETIFFD